ncbi:hypothetical protein HF086_008003 [Spodoptera exigua]|uniref:BESS domain-containing protein n=1 Tax=Spodoptera exigua TaxID=7107 RepID=A0A922SAK4_SPOEX|nr:hypothetical protein HF086_008003 [Spodoptera exigua]
MRLWPTTKKNFIKHKWRNLRDQFLRESKKVKVPFDNPTKPYIEYYRGKWIYFEKMLFLRKALPTNITLVDCDYPEELEVYDESIVKEEGEEFEENTLIANNMFSVDHSNFNGSTPIHSLCISNDNTLIINPKDEIVNKINNEEKEPDENIISSRKRKCSDSSESVVTEKSKRQSVDGYSSSNDQNEIDDDLHFLKSLVPFLKKLPPIRKLLVRNEIQNLLIRETLCDKCKGNTSDMC